MSKKIKGNTISGANWSILKMITTNVSQFVVSIVLARLIIPEHFGLIGMAMIFISFGSVFSTFGLRQAIVQKENLTKNDLKTGLTLSLLFGTLIYLILYISAPVIANFYNEEILISLIRFLALSFPIRGISAIALGLLMKNFEFKYVFYVELFSYIFGYTFITVILAFLGYGVWALAIGSISQAIIKTSFLIILTKNKINFGFDYKSAKELLFFGGGASSGSLFNNISGHIDYFIVGKFMSSHHVGLYTKAFGLMRIPMRAFSHVLGNVIFSSYSSMQKDLKQLRNAYYKSIRIITILSYPVITGMIISSYYIILGLYGENWMGAVGAFRVLSIAAYFKVTFLSSVYLVKSQGYVYGESIRQFLYAIVIGVGVLVGAQFNLVFVSLAIVFGSFIFNILIFQLSLKTIEGKWKELLKNLSYGIVLSIPVAILDITIILFFDIINLTNETVGLFLLILGSGIALLLGVILFPEKYKSSEIKWLLNVYGRFLPTKIKDLLINLL